MPKRINIVGEKYGELTVTEMLYRYNNQKHTYCKCVNDDGVDIIVRLDALRSGATKTAKGSVNKGKKKDLTNMKFGRLTVIKETDKKASNGGIIWKCICDCGKECEVLVSRLISGKTTSCGCRVQDYYNGLTRDVSGMRFGQLVAVKPIGRRGVVGNFKTVWRCRCDCGNEVDITLSDLSTGNTQSCGCNKISHGERFISDVLISNNIKFISQKTFDDCKNIRALRFDFYLQDYNVVVEFDGLQHFQPVDFFGGEDDLIIRQKRDEIKTRYCQEHKIHLVRIPYYYTKNQIEETILNILSPATITA